MIAAMLATLFAPIVSAEDEALKISEIVLIGLDEPVGTKPLDCGAIASSGNVTYIGHYTPDGQVDVAIPGTRIQTTVYIDLGTKEVAENVVCYWNGEKNEAVSITEKTVGGLTYRTASFIFYHDIPKLASAEITGLYFPTPGAPLDSDAFVSGGAVTEVTYKDSDGYRVTRPTQAQKITISVTVDFGKTVVDESNLSATWYGTESHSHSPIGDNKYRFLFDYTVPLYTAEITDLDGALEDTPIDTEATEAHGFRVTNVEYFNLDLSTVTKVVGGQKYLVYITVETGNVPFFSEAKAVWNGLESVLAEGLGMYQKRFCFEYTVPKIEYKDIDTVRLSIEEPKYMHSTPLSAKTESEGIAVESVSWNPYNAQFMAGNHPNTVTIRISETEGYRFITDFEVKGYAEINGKKATIKDIANPNGSINGVKQNPPVYEISYDFPPVSQNDDQKPDTPVTPEYVFPFIDVKKSNWYYEHVMTAHKMGLISGKSASTYNPNDTMTVAEAIKLAVCMNIVYNGGDPSTFKNGTEKWYSTYMQYALDKGIIDKDMSDVANDPISRLDYVYIFSKALPEKAFEAKNSIPVGSIPDIKNEEGAQNKAVYTFYRAGILAGVDKYGTFSPDSTIKRSEVAAILVRMMIPTYRVNAPEALIK